MRNSKGMRLSAWAPRFTCGIAAGIMSWYGSFATAGDWPGFRGPDALGEAREPGVFSSSSPIGLELAWKTKIGNGYSGVAVAGDQLVTAFSEGERDVLANFDTATGKRRWSVDLEPTYKGHDGSHDGPISTPFIDGKRVYMLGARGRLVAVSLQSGEVIWSSDLIAEHQAKAPFYGFATSPIVVDGVLIVEMGAPDGMVMGLDAATGKKLWAAGDDGVAYQSPVVTESEGQRVLLVGGSNRLLALNARDGKVHWSYEHSGGGARGSGSLVPVPAGDHRVFLANKDDESTVVEWGKDADGQKFKSLWEGRSIRNSYNVPVYHDGKLYAYSSRFLTCVDAATGDVAWKSRPPGDGFLILVDGHLVLATKNGSLHVSRAYAEGYQELGAISVFDDVVWSHPSFADGHIYARSEGELARVNVTHEKPETVVQKRPAGDMPDSDFGRFVASLSSAKDKNEALDRFLEKQKSFPIIEGDHVVHFVYRGPGTDLAVAGDMFGARQERPMIHVPDTDLFYFSMTVESDARLSYVFMRDYSTITDPNNPRTTITSLVNDEMEMAFGPTETKMSWFAMPRWSQPAFLSVHAEGPEGRVESHELESQALGKKHRIEVYLPAVYDLSKGRFPVAYVFGGDDARKHGQYAEALNRLCARQVEPLIAVFINEASFKQLETLPIMFGEELIPFIDRTFRTIASADARAAIGSGFAGTDAWYCAVKRPDLVNRIGGQSLFLFDSFSPDIVGLLKSPSEQPLNVYLDWGKYDFRNPHEAWDLGAKNRRIAETLEEKGYRPAGGEVNDGTGWPSWKNRTDRLLIALFPRQAD